MAAVITPASALPERPSARIGPKTPSRASGRLRFTVATAVPAALLTVYALIPEPPYGPAPFHDAWRRHLIVGVALLLWAGALLCARRLPRRIPLLAPLLLLLLVECLSVAAAPDWRIGVEPVLDLAAGIIIFAAVVDCPGLSAATLRWSLMLVAAGLSLACLAFVFGRLLDWRALVQAVPDAGAGIFPPTVPRVLAVGTNPNIIAPLMTFAAPLYLISAVESGARRRIFLLIGALIIQAGVFFTLSRAAWAGELAGLALTVILVGLSGSSLRHLSAPARRWVIASLVAIVGVLCALAVAAVLILSLGWRPQWLFRPTVAARTDFRGAALQMIAMHPVLGSGPGSFSLNYPYISNGDPAGAVHSHNIPIEIAVESGIAGLLAALIVALDAVTILWRVWQRGSKRQRFAIAAVAGALTNFAVTGMADALQLFPEILFALGMLLAIAIRTGSCAPGSHVENLDVGRAGEHRSLVPAFNRLASLVPFALASAILLAWFAIDLANEHYIQSIALASQQRWLASASQAEHASAIDPAESLYLVQEALSLEMAHEAGLSASGRERAIALLQQALEIEPRSSITRLDLMALLQSDSQGGAALAQAPLMVAGAPRDSLVLLAAGVVEEPARPEQAMADYAAAIAESPRIADSPFWQATEFRRQHFGDIVQQALSRASTEDSSSGPDAVRQIIGDTAGVYVATGAGGSFVSQIDLARRDIREGDGSRATEILDRAVRERPDDPSVRLALGELHQQRGDLRAARREWLAGAYLGDVESIMDLGNTSPSGRVPPKIVEMGRWGLSDLWDRQFSLAVQHYRFAYRRQEPLPIVLPGDWLNALPALYARLKSSVDRWEAGTNPAPG